MPEPTRSLLFRVLVGLGIIATWLTAAAQDPWPGSGPGVPPAPDVHTPPGYNVRTLPGPPATPIAPQRPPSWPGSRPADAPADDAAYIASLKGALPPIAPSSPLRDSGVAVVDRCLMIQMVASVANEAVLMTDLVAIIDERLEQGNKLLKPEQRAEKEKAIRDQIVASGYDFTGIPPELWEREYYAREIQAAVKDAQSGLIDRYKMNPMQAARRNMLEIFLRQATETKLVYYDAKRKIPREGLVNVEKQIVKQFEQAEAKDLLKRAGVETWNELDEYLKARGSSLEREKRLFAEKMLSQQWVRQQMKTDEEITLEQITNYYRTRPKEFDRPARTQWQMLWLDTGSFISKAEARRKMATLGNRVLAGEDLGEVGRSGDADGRVREWPDPERHQPDVVVRAIESLAAGELSPILEDRNSLYIVRVIERRPASRVPFDAAQAEIREKIKKQRMEDQITKYLKTLREQVPVWTIIDDPNAPVSTSSKWK